MPILRINNSNLNIAPLSSVLIANNQVESDLHIDFNGTQLINATIEELGSLPSVTNNRIVVVTGNLYICLSGAWYRLTTSINKYMVDVGDGASTAITVTHNLNTKDVIVETFDNSSTYDRIYPEVSHTTVNTVTLTFTTAPTSNQYHCVVVG